MDLSTGALLLLAVFLWLAIGLYLLYQSLYLLKPDQKIIFYNLGGTYLKTVVGSTYYVTETERIAKKGGRVETALRVFRMELVFALWPFALGYRLTSTQFEVPIHASQMYTDANHRVLPRVRMEGDATLQFRLSDNPTHLALVFPLFDQGLGSIMGKQKRDLTRRACLKDLGLSPSGEQVYHEHHVQRVALIFHSVLNKPMQEAMREAATYFTFSTSEGEQDIIRQRAAFEIKVKELVVADSGNVFREGRLFDEHGNPDASLLVGDMIVESLQLQAARESDSPAIKAIDRVFVGRQEGKAQEVIEMLTRAGQAEGIKVLTEALKLKDTQAAYLLDVLRQSGKEVNLTQLGLSEDAIGALKRLLQGNSAGTPS
jgi:hypothetical protein